MNLYENLVKQSRERPNQQAIVDYTDGRFRSWRFMEMERAATGVATVLHQQGLVKGDGVLVTLPVSAELYLVILACFRLGLVVILPDPHAGLQQFQHCCSVYPVRGFIGSARAHMLRLFSSPIRRIDRKFCIDRGLPGSTRLPVDSDYQKELAVTPCEPLDPALVTFTSGSTGKPKAVVRSHDFLQAQHRAISSNLPLAPRSVDLSLFPVFVLSNLASGNTSLLPDIDYRNPAEVDPEKVFEPVFAHQPDQVAASPAVLESLVEYARQNRIVIKRRMRICTGGAPIFPSLLKNLESVFPLAEIVTVYGSTEAEPIAKIAFSELRDGDMQAMQTGSGLLVGRPVPEIKLRILPDEPGMFVHEMTENEFNRLTVVPGQAGEIVVSGDHVLKGYLGGIGDHETKVRVDKEIWHRTGDAGYLDRDGRLWLLGRCQARVKDDHGVTYPFAIETAARQFPDVVHAAFMQAGGRRVIVIQSRRQPSERLARKLKRRLGNSAIDEIRFLSRIPVDPRHNAKIDYQALNRIIGTDTAVREPGTGAKRFFVA